MFVLISLVTEQSGSEREREKPGYHGDLNEPMTAALTGFFTAYAVHTTMCKCVLFFFSD